MRNKYVKAAAVVLLVIAVSAGMFIAADAICSAEGDLGFIYAFEKDVREAPIIYHYLAKPADAVFYGSESNNNLPPDGIDSDILDYYILYKGKVYTNSEENIEHYTGAEHYIVIETHGGDYTYESSAKRREIFVPEKYVNDEIKIYSAIKPAFADSILQTWNEQRDIIKNAFSIGILLICLSLALIVYILFVCGRSGKDEEVHLLLIDRMYVEFTLSLLVLTVIGTVAGFLFLLEMYLYENLADYMLKQLMITLGAAGILLIITFMTSIVRNIKNKSFLSRSLTFKILRFLCLTAKKCLNAFWNFLVRIIGGTRYLLSKKPLLLGVSVIIAGGLCMMMFSALSVDSEGLLIIPTAILALAVVYTVKQCRMLDALREGLFQIKSGNIGYKIEKTDKGVLGSMCSDLNVIGEGLKKSLETELKAERMKTELITNVSHDLKTPLTSIISYAELLSKEDLAPSEANDYVKIIMQKSQRLKNLTADLFEISKIQSGNESFKIEKVNLSLLLSQSLGENDSEIKKSGLDFKVKIDEGAFAAADGTKMARVFENLINNAVKYAMPNTRVYVSLEKGEKTKIEIKNIASYPMDFDEEEITERFMRGDKNRTDGGSGLGLAIAKSYTEAFGGTLKVTCDGDLFKVTVTL